MIAALMQTDQEAIRELLSAWHRATVTGDLPRLLELMAEDVVFLVAGQAPMRGREAFATAFRMGQEHYRIDYTWEVQEIHVTQNLAYCWCHLVVTVAPLKALPPMRRSGYTLTILRKNPAGNWVVSRDANMLSSEHSAIVGDVPHSQFASR
jgi:uncharacterized protein (TIGR02246 family)